MTQSRNNKLIKQIPFLGIFLALSLVLSYVESLIPFYFGIPGMKLGLTNIMVMLMLYTLGPTEALLISLLRILLSGFMFGNAFSIFYSLAGGLLSFAVMYLLKRFTRLSILSVSVAGGVSHNFGQVLVAMIVISNAKFIYYFFVLMISGVITGALIGFISGMLLPRLRPMMKKAGSL